VVYQLELPSNPLPSLNNSQVPILTSHFADVTRGLYAASDEPAVRQFYFRLNIRPWGSQFSRVEIYIEKDYIITLLILFVNYIKYHYYCFGFYFARQLVKINCKENKNINNTESIVVYFV